MSHEGVAEGPCVGAWGWGPWRLGWDMCIACRLSVLKGYAWYCPRSHAAELGLPSPAAVQLYSARGDDVGR